jgi:hypothetical protein
MGEKILLEARAARFPAMNNNKSALFLFTFLFVLRARFLGHALLAVGMLLLAVGVFSAPPT